MRASHTRIVNIPQPESIQGGRLDSVRVESGGKRQDLVMDFQGFAPSQPSLMLLEENILYERLEGYFFPRRLRFTGVSEVAQTGLYENLDALPLTHAARTIRDIISWRPIGTKKILFILINSAPDDAELTFYADEAIEEPRKGKQESITFVRDWSSPPPMPARLAPEPKGLHRQFGGDPIEVRVNGQTETRRLFIGGLHMQGATRPIVDAVLNLGEQPSRWGESSPPDPRDRRVNKGEGRDGMAIEEITEEAMWVIERLRKGKRALVHCVAGMNRSSTICCAVVMLLEGLSAEEALERVRQHHPWARPDSHHWLTLRWLASTIRK